MVKMKLRDLKFEISGKNGGKKPDGFWSVLVSIALMIKAIADHIDGYPLI